jgi:hypothetical protein
MDHQRETDAAVAVESSPAPEKPRTMKDVIGGVLLAMLVLGLGIAMISNPDAVPSTESSGRHRTQTLLWILSIIWGRTGGIVLVCLAVFVIVGMFMKKRSDTPKP